MGIVKFLQTISGSKKDLAGAANEWAGTTGLDLLGALNKKAGTTGLGFNAVVKKLGGGNTEAYAGLRYLASNTPAPKPVAWYRAEDLALANGAAVASWPDAGLNGYTLAQGTTAARPTYVASAVNGKPAVRFTAASTQYLERTIAMPGLFNAASGYTVVAVCSLNTTAATQILHFLSTGTVSTAARARASFSATNRYPNPQARHLDADASPVTATATTGSSASAATYFITTQNVDWTTGSFAAYKNGASVLSATGTLATGAVSATDALAMRMGCQSTGSGLWLDGWVAELIVYDRTLTADERTRVHSYLGTKYAIAVT